VITTCYPAATLAADNTRESGVRCIEEQEAEEAVRKCRGLRSSQSLGAARRMPHAACRMLRAMSTPQTKSLRQKHFKICL